MSKVDLNASLIPSADSDGEPLVDYGITSTGADITVHFRNLANHLCHYISEADYVFGCVAWLTHPEILAELAKKKGVLIVVQKEDFLRPDTGMRRGVDTMRRVRDLYRQLPESLYRYDLPVLSNCSTCNDPTLDPIRCLGNHNRSRSPAFPRAHNKFVVFARASLVTADHRGQSCTHYDWHPYAVWTGSFNFSKNAGNSLENAVVIQDEKVAGAYFNETMQLAALSEPLSWDSDWMEPEWRLGT